MTMIQKLRQEEISLYKVCANRRFTTNVLQNQYTHYVHKQVCINIKNVEENYILGLRLGLVSMNVQNKLGFKLCVCMHVWPNICLIHELGIHLYSGWQYLQKISVISKMEPSHNV